MFRCNICKQEYDNKYLEKYSKYISRPNYYTMQNFTCMYCSAEADNRAYKHMQETKVWVDLSNQYPRIFNMFSGYDILGKPIIKPAPVAGGIGIGWFDIIKDTSEKIQIELDKISPDAYCQFTQMKEKFGGLRWYTTTPEKRSIYRTIVRWWNYKVLVSYNKLLGKYVLKYKLYKLRLPYPRNPIEKLIDEAEELSYKTCEECGKPGITYTTGWHLTLCEEHAKERGYLD